MFDTGFMNELLDDPIEVDTMSAQYSRINAQRYRLNPSFYTPGIASIAPAISMCSTGHDMAKWLHYHLHGSSSSLMPRDLWNDLHTTVTATPNERDMYRSEIQQPQTPVNLVLNGYALGWFTGHYRGWLIVNMHTISQNLI